MGNDRTREEAGGSVNRDSSKEEQGICRSNSLTRGPPFSRALSHNLKMGKSCREVEAC